MPDNSTSPWLAGHRLDQFPGVSMDVQIAHAALEIGADILSPSADFLTSPSPDPSMAGHLPFTTKHMVDEAHRLGMAVKPFTVSFIDYSPSKTHPCSAQVNRLNIVEQLLSWGVDGIITDCKSA